MSIAQTRTRNEKAREGRKEHDRPLFRADWDRVLFLHFEMDPRVLQPSIPFELDTSAGRAYVSLVAFTQRRLRPVFGGRLAQLLCAPLAEHEFLNVRTYVRHRGERGIYFIAEWIPNRLAALIGPRTYGLPYQLGELTYDHDPQAGRFSGRVRAAGEELTYSATADPLVRYGLAQPGSLEEFLLERYVAFTSRRGVHRRFAVCHGAWRQMPVNARLNETGLLRLAGPWHDRARLCAAHASPGVNDVTICMPRRSGVR